MPPGSRIPSSANAEFPHETALAPEQLPDFLDYDIAARKQRGSPGHDSEALLQGQVEVLKRISSGAPLEESLTLLCRVIEGQAPGLLSSILILDADGIHIRHCAAPGLPQKYLDAIDGQKIGPNAGSCGTAAYSGKAVIVEDIATDPLWESYRDCALAHNLRACWSTPIFDPDRRVLGTFALYFHSARLPSEHHLRLIDIATHTAAIAIFRHRRGEALRAWEERFRIATARGNIGIWDWEISTNTLVWNESLLSMFGLPQSPGRLTRDTFLNAIHPDDRALVDSSIAKALQSCDNHQLEYRIVRPDGAVRWISSEGHTQYGDDGRPRRMIGAVTDVTERKITERVLNQRKEQLEQAERIAHIGSYEWDVRTNTVHRSEELCRLFGITAGQFEPTFEGYLQRVHPSSRDRTRRIIEESLRDRKPFDLEECIVRPDGSLRTLHSRGNWTLNEQGEPLKLVGTCQDVTERKRIEDERQRSEQRFEFAALAAHDAIWEWDLQEDTLWWSQGSADLLGGEADRPADLDWWIERIHPEDRDRVMSGIYQAFDRREQFWCAEFRLRRLDDSYADVLDRGYVIYDDEGRAVRMIGAIADVTERKRAFEVLERRVAQRTGELQTKNLELESEIRLRQEVEQQLRTRNEDLKAFAYTISHDLKAPLRGMAGYAQELHRRHGTELSARGTFCVQQILTATTNLDRLIEDLLHYSRLDAERPTTTEVDVPELVERVLRERGAQIAETGAEVAVTPASAMIMTWERGLAQVLANLFDNALKYSRDARPPRIQIHVEDRRDVLKISVTDNGIGFDMQYHDRIFGLFNRLVRQEDFEGTGAGLAIVAKVIAKLGGKVRAHSSPGAGATFSVELPR